MGELDPHLICGSWPTQVLDPNGIWMGSTDLQGSLVFQTNRQTDRQSL